MRFLVLLGLSISASAAPICSVGLSVVDLQTTGCTWNQTTVLLTDFSTSGVTVVPESQVRISHVFDLFVEGGVMLLIEPTSGPWMRTSANPAEVSLTFAPIGTTIRSVVASVTAPGTTVCASGEMGGSTIADNCVPGTSFSQDVGIFPYIAPTSPLTFTATIQEGTGGQIEGIRINATTPEPDTFALVGLTIVSVFALRNTRVKRVLSAVVNHAVVDDVPR